MARFCREPNQNKNNVHRSVSRRSKPTQLKVLFWASFMDTTVDNNHPKLSRCPEFKASPSGSEFQSDMTLVSRYLLLASLAFTLAAGSRRRAVFKPLIPYLQTVPARNPSVIGGLLRVRQGCGLGESECGNGCCDIGTSCCSGTPEPGPLWPLV
jgi:hypothetical protein